MENRLRDKEISLEEERAKAEEECRSKTEDKDTTISALVKIYVMQERKVGSLTAKI